MSVLFTTIIPLLLTLVLLYTAYKAYINISYWEELHSSTINSFSDSSYTDTNIAITGVVAPHSTDNVIHSYLYNAPSVRYSYEIRRKLKNSTGYNKLDVGSDHVSEFEVVDHETDNTVLVQTQGAEFSVNPETRDELPKDSPALQGENEIISSVENEADNSSDLWYSESSIELGDSVIIYGTPEKSTNTEHLATFSSENDKLLISNLDLDNTTKLVRNRSIKYSAIFMLTLLLQIGLRFI